MRVLHVIGSLNKEAGGPSRSVPQSCEHLSRLGIEIAIITRPSNSQVKVATSDKLTIKNLTFWKLIIFGLTISNKNISLIHLQHVWDPYIHVMAWYARIKGIKYVITPRGMLEPWIMNQNRWKKKLGMFLYQKRDLQKANCIHVTSKLEKENIRKLGINSPIVIIPNGIITDVYPGDPPVKSQFPKKILFLSRIHKKKGIEFLIEAWSRIDEKTKKNWIIEIIGNGKQEYIDSLQHKIDECNLKDQILILPPVYGDQKTASFREASLFVLPTFSENFGIVIAEALASYTPVITTIGTPWEELNLLYAGWWIDIGVESLKSTLNSALLKEKSELIKMGCNGRNLIIEKYDIRMVAKKIKELYQNL